MHIDINLDAGRPVAIEKHETDALVRKPKAHTSGCEYYHVHNTSSISPDMTG